MFSKKTHSDQYLIHGIRNNDPLVLKKIYQDFYKMVFTLVTQNSGSDEDAQEIMQRSLMAVYERLQRDRDFTLTSKFSTFLHGVARNLWLKEIRKKKPELLLTDDEKMGLIGQGILEIDLSEEDLAAQRHILFWKSFEKLGDDCKKLLRKFFDEIDPGEIAKTLGITYGSYRVKKNRCVRRLTSLIKERPDYLELKRS